MQLHRVPLIDVSANRTCALLLFHQLRLDVFGSRLSWVLSEVGTLFQSAVAEGYEHVSELERTLPSLTLCALVRHNNCAVIVDCRFHVFMFCCRQVGYLPRLGVTISSVASLAFTCFLRYDRLYQFYAASFCLCALLSITASECLQKYTCMNLSKHNSVSIHNACFGTFLFLKADAGQRSPCSF